MQNNYGFFEDPDFVQKQNELAALKDKLKKAKDEFKPEKTFDDPYNFDTSFFENKQKEIPLGIGKDPNYMNPITAGNDADMAKGFDFMGVSSDKTVDGNTETMKSSEGMLKSGSQDPIGTTVSFGTSVLSSSKTTSANDGEAAMNAINLTAKGAQAGMSIGGPIGAAIGAGAGFVYGVADGLSDGDKREREQRDEAKRLFIAERTTREQEQRMKDGKDSLEKLTALSKAQLGYMV